MSSVSCIKVLRSVKGSAAELVSNQDIRVLFLVFSGIWFVNDLYRQIVPLLFNQFGYSTVILGVALSMVAVIEVIISPITGVIADTFDRLAVGGIASLGLAVLFTAFALSDSLQVFIVLMAGVGGFHTLLNNTATAAISESFSDNTKGIGWGIRDASIYLGGAAGLAVGGGVVAWVTDVRVAFLPCILLLLGMSALSFRRSLISLSGGRIASELSSLSRLKILDPFREFSDWNILYRFLVVKVLSGLGMGGTMFLLPVFATDIGIGASNYLFLLATSSLLGVGMSLLGGIALQFVHSKHLYVLNFAVEAAMLFGFAITTNAVFFVVGIGLFAVQTAFEPAVITFFFDKFDDDEGGRAWSIDGMVSKGVGIAAPVVGGAIYSIDPQTTFALGGVLTMLAAIVAVTIPE